MGNALTLSNFRFVGITDISIRFRETSVAGYRSEADFLLRTKRLVSSTAKAVVAQKDINAFALPGGPMFVNLGRSRFRSTTAL